MTYAERKTAAEWQVIVDAYRASGLSLYRYAEQEGLNYFTLRYHTHQISREEARQEGNSPRRTWREKGLTVSFANGVVLRVPSSVVNKLSATVLDELSKL